MSQNSSVYYNIERDRKSYFWIMTAIEKVTFVFIKLIILAVTDNTLSEIGKNWMSLFRTDKLYISHPGRFSGFLTEYYNI